jgi:hypothetical protein
MIPEFNHSNVLPPFVGGRMSSADSSPYRVEALELARRFGRGVDRCDIVRGLFRYRAELRELGFVQGFQWLDGSFVEDIESREGRPPRDIDVVTFAFPPGGQDPDAVRRLLLSRPDVFDLGRCKAGFRCDAHLVNLAGAPEWLVTQTRYWYGLFSHRRGDTLWKGMLQLSLDSDDEAAVRWVESVDKPEDDHVGAA